MHRNRLFYIAAIAAFVSGPMSVAAQEGDGLRTLAGFPRHTRDEENQIERWVRQQIDVLRSSNGAEARSAFRERFWQLGGTSPPFTVTQGFRDVLAAKCSKLWPKALQKARSARALCLAMAIAGLESAHAVPGLTECLKHENQGVRYWGLKGLQRLRPRLAESEVFAWRAIEAIQEAARYETSPILLREAYAALDYATRKPAPSVSLLLNSVDAAETLVHRRVQQYRDGSVRGIEGDQRAAALLANLWSSDRLPLENRRRLLALLGCLLKGAAELYIEVPPSLPKRRALPDVVAACEFQLRRIWRRAHPEALTDLPNVHALLLSDHHSSARIQLEVFEWVGTEDVSGVLNRPPLDAPIPSEFSLKDDTLDTHATGNES